ncbi:S1 RNA-binding domain-containing protein [Roseiconus nitratireducens]|uniref:S1 RNA-binding domain-containing protein n=1 Tax=Roseiconus nitratireducens TaxID=2605748 RepID=A0A5M6D6C2_9BACT|nr:S1 RNA-binding domain-containing protein [Roseiconus nitratireducens]KAA5540735.1 S1 RNA-binding domain-containing protein [Roseiconus nitratireducens]
MAVDLEAIARRGRCDASSLKLAMPLLEQGYTAPFLARYRRDELGGLDEATLWSLKAAMDAETSLAEFRDELYETWQSTPLADPSIGDAIKKSGSKRTLQRLHKRLRGETGTSVENDASRLAVRLLNPEKGDPADPKELAESMPSISDADAAVEGLQEALPARLAGDPRVINAAVRWLSRNAKIHVSNVHDPHIEAGDAQSGGKSKSKSGGKKKKKSAKTDATAEPAGATAEQSSGEQSTAEPTTAEPTAEQSAGQSPPSAGETAQAVGESSSSSSAAPGTADAAPGQQADSQSESSSGPAAESSSGPAAESSSSSASESEPTKPASDASGQETAAQDSDSDRHPGGRQESANQEPNERQPADDGSTSSNTESSDAAASDAAVSESSDTPPEAAPTAASADPPANAEATPAESDSSDTATSTDATSTDARAGSDSEAQSEPASEANADQKSGEDLPGFQPDPDSKPADKKPAEKEAAGKKSSSKKPKKISPRQRRRRWLVSVLKPLEGKRLQATKLSAFQIVMLGRALRSQVAVCAFEYDAAKLVAEIKRSVVGLNKSIEPLLDDIVMRHEADIREAAEAAWWDELHERASARLVGIAADHLRRHVNRGPVDAKVVMSIDAIGPKTAATAIVSADGRVLEGEDLPCQLSGAVRGQTVAKMGELIHQHGVDLVVVSNGPARRACLIALGDLIAQSPEGSIRWTVADRTGADAYASSDVANSEMRSTPRRFRAAAWIAFSILHPAQAYAKVDPLRLRLASFQSELSDEALEITLGDIMASGASRGGVDANAAPLGWLRQLPGMSDATAQALVSRREQTLLKSRQELLALEGWAGAVETRQALPFLRIFESDEPLDATLIHPDDYSLAKKLATALEIELPPAAPPGYQAPDYQQASEEAKAAELKLVDATTPKPQPAVEDFDKAGEKAGEFTLPDDADSSASDSQADAATSEASAMAASDADSDASPQTEPVQPAGSADESPEGEPQAASDSSETSDAETEAPEADATSEQASDQSAGTPEAPAEETPAAVQVVKRPRPEQAKIDKCIKEWQVGKHRVHQLVGWLCDPFGETAVSDDPPGVLTTMPTLKTLKTGDQVVGVVVGVMAFGVFVELAPDCSGLIHVSRLSDGYVEDLNEAIQVGDVVTAWVTGIDEKRRRVGLSALSPQQEAAAEQARQDRGDSRRDSRRGGKPAGGRGRGGAGRSDDSGRGRGRGAGASSGGSGRGGRGKASGGPPRGGRSRDQRGGRKSRQPESYRVVAKPEAKPISDAMQKGDEPLRSFGDLLQFYSGSEKKSAEKQSDGKPQQKSKPKAEESQAAGDPPASDATPAAKESPAESAPSAESKTGDANSSGASE